MPFSNKLGLDPSTWWLLREVEDVASKKDRFWYVVKREMILQRKDH